MNKNHKPNKNQSKTRGASIRAQKRNQDDAHKIVSQFADASQKPPRQDVKIADAEEKLKVTFLGGLQDVGEKNLAIIECGNDAIVLDCGMNLGIDLPGVNYEINDTTYLTSIKHKLRAYVITHGHLDHIGALRHTVPDFPAPIYGSRYTIGIIEKSFDDEMFSSSNNFTPKLIVVNIDNHERFKIGCFFVEFIRSTHAIPEPAVICIDTPLGRIIATGDFRLDPEPLDNLHVDKVRLKQLGDEGVLLLLSDSSYADVEGRTPTEHTLQKSFEDIISDADGRIFVAVFSSNMNRTQMIINAAIAARRKVALDGRSMIAYAEIAVRQGILKVPKGTIVTMAQASTIPANRVLVMCTGGQGEPNAALQRMSEGEHKFVNLSQGDTVIISSTPIPGNEISYDQISNRLARKGVRLFRHVTHELDGSGPLHVSGHAKRDELREMLQLTRPKFLIPVHAGTLHRTYHAELGVQEGLPRQHCLVPENGDCLYFTPNSMEYGGVVKNGSVLIDQTGSTISGVIIKDRLMLGEDGILAVVLTIDKQSGQLLTSPDIISRGFVEMTSSKELMQALRTKLRITAQQRYRKLDLERFKQDIRDFLVHFLFDQTGRSPIVIPVVNIVDDKVPARTSHTNSHPKSAQRDFAVEQKRFQQIRSRLLNQDQRD